MKNKVTFPSPIIICKLHILVYKFHFSHKLLFSLCIRVVRYFCLVKKLKCVLSSEDIKLVEFYKNPQFSRCYTDLLSTTLGHKGVSVFQSSCARLPEIHTVKHYIPSDRLHEASTSSRKASYKLFIPSSRSSERSISRTDSWQKGTEFGNSRVSSI